MLPESRITEELAGIAATNGGLLLPGTVVEFARDPNTALHSKFDWDDSEAAAKWRLEQARTVIRMNVTVINQDLKPVRAFVSLSSDRTHGGGYRRIADVLSDSRMASEMIRDALMDLKAVRARYEKLKALAPVWKALDEVENDIEHREVMTAHG